MLYDRLGKLTIQDKFKVVEATKVYPHFLNDNIDIEEDWKNRVCDKITERQLTMILAS